MNFIRHPRNIILEKMERSCWDDESKSQLCSNNYYHEKITRNNKLEDMKRIYADKNRNGIPDVFEKKLNLLQRKKSKWI